MNQFFYKKSLSWRQIFPQYHDNILHILVTTEGHVFEKMSIISVSTIFYKIQKFSFWWLLCDSRMVEANMVCRALDPQILYQKVKKAQKRKFQRCLLLLTMIIFSLIDEYILHKKRR